MIKKFFTEPLTKTFWLFFVGFLVIGLIVSCITLAMASEGKLLHAIIVLDESGSMSEVRQEAINAFNKQVATLKKEAHEVQIKLTLVKFATVPETVFWAEDIASREKLALSKENYAPDGNTALLDAVGLVLMKFRLCHEAELKDSKTTFLVILISDGLENNSEEFSWNDVARLVRKVNQNERWKFVYLGSDLDLGKIKETFDIGSGSIHLFNTTDTDSWNDTSTNLSTGTSGFIKDSLIGDDSIEGDFFEKDCPEGDCK